MEGRWSYCEWGYGEWGTFIIHVWTHGISISSPCCNNYDIPLWQYYHTKIRVCTNQLQLWYWNSFTPSPLFLFQIHGQYLLLAQQWKWYKYGELRTSVEGMRVGRFYFETKSWIYLSNMPLHQNKMSWHVIILSGDIKQPLLCELQHMTVEYAAYRPVYYMCTTCTRPLAFSV